MKRFFKILLFFISVATSGNILAQEKWSLVQDLNENWLYYEGQWLPVTDRFDEYDVIFFRINEWSQGYHLLIRYPGEFSVFTDNKILVSAKDSLMVRLDSIPGISGGAQNPLFAVYSDELKPAKLKTQLMMLYDPSTEPKVNDIINVIKRDEYHIRDFAVVAFLFIIVIVAVLKTFYTRSFHDFYNIRKMLSSRDVDEDFLRGRLFSQVNLIIMLMQCIVISLFVTLILIFYNFSLVERLQSLFEYFYIWFKIFLYTMLFVMMKFILVRNFTTLYNIPSFSTPHFMSFMRIITFTFTLGLGVLYFGMFILKTTDTSYLGFGVNLVLVLLGISTILVFLKLLNSVSYKSLHLFSYLCATELLPYVVLLKVVINQSI